MKLHVPYIGEIDLSDRRWTGLKIAGIALCLLPLFIVSVLVGYSRFAQFLFLIAFATAMVGLIFHLAAMVGVYPGASSNNDE
jgi:hypothetical protein